MKIAIFTDSFVPGIGGTEYAVLNFAKALSENHQVMVFAPAYKQPFPDDEMPFKIIRAKSIKVTNTDYWAMPGITKDVRLALEQFKPDVLHCQSVGMMVGYANAYGRKHNIPVIHTIHTNYKVCYLHAFKNRLIANILLKHVMRRTKKADCVCSVSNFMSDQLKSYGIKHDIIVIRNGGNKNANQPNRVCNDKFEFLFVGSLSLIKNIDFALRALKEVKGSRGDFVFKIVGAGPDEKKLKRMVDELGLQDHVEFIGSIRDKNELNEYYAQSDLFLFPSVIDNDPLVILESANKGTATLAIENTGSAERLTDGQTGFISQGTEKAYAARILELMSDREKVRRVGKQAGEIFSSWQDTASEYVKLYAKLLANKAN